MSMATCHSLFLSISAPQTCGGARVVHDALLRASGFGRLLLLQATDGGNARWSSVRLVSVASASIKS
jgi:hypothetical protein